MSRWESFVQKVKAHWRSWIAIKFSFNLLLFSLELWYNRRIQVVAISKKMILLNRVISVLLSGIYFTLPSRLSRFLALPWDISNISFDSDSSFTYWGCEELRSLLIMLLSFRSQGNLPLVTQSATLSVKWTSYSIPSIRLCTLLYLSNAICCECAKTITFVIYHYFD